MPSREEVSKRLGSGAVPDTGQAVPIERSGGEASEIRQGPRIFVDPEIPSTVFSTIQATLTASADKVERLDILIYLHEAPLMVLEAKRSWKRFVGSAPHPRDMDIARHVELVLELASLWRPPPASLAAPRAPSR